ncbi:MAG: class IV adenylate cyclase [bacterium]
MKIEVPDADAIARRLEALGAELVVPRSFEDNRLFDLADLSLARTGRLLRLRTCNGRATLTGKGPAPADAATTAYKVRVEEETQVADVAGLVKALAAAGLEARWRYQKWRREYRLAGASVVVDEIPHGTFVEIEAEPTVIDEVAARLGFDRAAYVRRTYREIHEERSARAGGTVGDMLFESAPGAER